MRIYIETSAILYLLADTDPYKKDRTVEMYEQFSTMNAQLFISQIVNAELSKAPPVLGKCVQTIMDKKKIFQIPLSESHIKLAHTIVEHSILQPSLAIEALHIATAIESKCDLLITWDFEALFNVQMHYRFKEIVIEMNLSPLTIGNPEMFLRKGFGSPKTLQDLRNMRIQLIGQTHNLKTIAEEIKKNI